MPRREPSPEIRRDPRYRPPPVWPPNPPTPRQPPPPRPAPPPPPRQRPAPPPPPRQRPATAAPPRQPPPRPRRVRPRRHRAPPTAAAKRPRRARRWGRAAAGRLLAAGQRGRRRRGLARLDAAARGGAGRLPGPATAGTRHHLAAGGLRQQTGPVRRASRTRWPPAATPATAAPTPCCCCTSARRSPARQPTLVSLPRDSYVADSRLRPGQDQRRLRVRRRAAAGADRRAGHRAAARPLRRDRVRRVRRARRRRRRGDDVPGRTDQRPAGRHRSARRAARNSTAATRSASSAPGPPPRADLDRMTNQRAFMSALLKRATSPSVLLNPLRWYPMVARRHRRGDRRPGWARLGPGPAGVGPAGRSDRHHRARSPSTPAATSGSIVVWDSEAAGRLFGALAHDTPVPPDVLNTDQP